VSFGGISWDIQAAVDRARRHGWFVCETCSDPHRVIMARLGTAWGACITTDGMGHVVIYRI
jgi:hypothetical protein